MLSRIGRIVSLMIVAMLIRGALPALGQVAQPAVGEVRPGEFRAGGYPETYNGGVFYPGTELRALPVARAQAVVAAAEFRRAQLSLDNAILEIRRSYLRSAELRDALAEQKSAFDELHAARMRAVQTIQEDPTYQAAFDLRMRLVDQIEQGEKLTPAERLALATVKLSYATTVTAMEAAAMSADPSVASARQRLIAVGRRLAELNEQHDESIRTSPAVMAARKAVEDTRIAAVGADALFVEARNVASTAMTFAYHLYDRPQPYVLNNPLYGGYGYSYRAGYPVGYPIGYPRNWWSSSNPPER